jgi:hypothetical protein
MNDLVVMQPNTSYFYLSESMCSSDVSTNLKLANKTPTAPIVGKKIVSELKIPLVIDEKPPPFQIFTKKKPHNKPISKQSKTRKRPKLKLLANKKPAPETKKFQILKKTPPSTNLKQTHHRSLVRNKTFHEDNQKENLRAQPTQKLCPSNIDYIIKNTLKKEMINKIKQEKEKKGLEDLKEIRKNQINLQNIQIREENARFKKIKFTPKYNWGVDQSKIKDPRRRSSKEKNIFKRPKSSERVRTGLDTIKEIQMELGLVQFRSRSLSQKSNYEENSSKRIPWQPNPEVKAYMKKQELCRKQKKIYENLHKFAEESRRRDQLQKLEEVNKPFTLKKRSKKSKKIKNKKTKNVPEKESIHEDPLINHKNINLVYEPDSSPSNPAHNLDLRVPDLSNPNKYLKETSSSNLFYDKGFNSDEENIPSQSSGEQEIRQIAAIKIQSHIRRFLVQKRLEKSESFSSVDMQVENIINKWSEKGKNSYKPNLNSPKPPEKKQKPLVISIPSSDSEKNSPEYSINLSENLNSYDQQSEFDSFKEQKGIEDTQNFEESQDQKDFMEIQEKKQEYQEKLKEQLIWREAQMHSLEYLRQKEIKDMQTIASKVGKSEELGEMLSNIVEKRYNQLSALFEENFRSVQEVLIQDMDTDEREKFEETLEEKRENFSKLIENDSKTMEEYIEDIMSRNELQKSDSSAEDRPVIYKPKSQISLISDEAEVNNPKTISILSPIQKELTYIQESTIHQNSSDEEKQESLNIFINEIGVSPKFSKEMKQIQILSFSPEKSARKKIIRPETPPDDKEPILIEESSLDVSGPPQDNSLLGQLISDYQGPSYTPDYIPERPSAPLQYFGNNGSNISPGIASSSENDIAAEENSDVEWSENNQLDITPDLVNDLAEQILVKLIQEENNGQRRNFPEISLIDIINIGPAPEGSLSSDPRIETDPAAIKRYIDEIFSNSDIKDLEKNLKVPLQRKPLEVLNRMQEIEIGAIIENEFYAFPEVLSVNLYLNLENTRENSTMASISPRIHQLIIEAEHIHNKMIFDALNESFQKYRPYGTKGVPMPWSNNTRCIGHTKPINKIIEEVKDELLDWTTIQAGKICTEDMLMSNGALDEELLQQVREERLANMLADEIIEKDEIWTNYEFEETQVKLDLANMILEYLANESIIILD